MIVLLRLLALMRPYRTTYLLAVIALVGATALFLLLPQQVGAFFQVISLPTGSSTISQMAKPGIQIVVLARGQAMLAGIYGYLANMVAERVGNDLRYRFFANLLQLPLATETHQQSGEIASEFMSDLSIIQAGLGDNLISFARHILFTIGALVAMFVFNTWMALITLLSAAMVAGLSLACIKLATRALIRMQTSRAIVVATLLEAANNRYVIQAFGRGEYFQKRFSDQLGSMFVQVRGYQRVMALINPVIFIFLAGATLGVMMSGISEINSGRMQAGHLVTFITYVLILVAAIMHAGTTAGNLLQAAAMFEKHNSLFADTPATETRRLAAPHTRHDAKAYSFQDVHFAYPGTSGEVLKGVSFTVPAGKVTALVGDSGAGKSTIAGLILGLIEPCSGTIQHEPCDAAESPAIAVVPQQPFLFTGTMSENIEFGREWVDDVAVRFAAGQAHIGDFIANLADGYEHQISEGGSNLSRGQQQRIALARALADRPGTLILDEATASLDVASERVIATTLRQARGDTTILVIAHQGDLLAQVDHLVVLRDGVIAYEGSPSCFENGNNSFPQVGMMA